MEMGLLLLKKRTAQKQAERDDDELPPPEPGMDKCITIRDDGFSYKKSFKQISKKMSSTVAWRLKTQVTKALLKENKCDDRILEKKIGMITRNQQRSASFIDNQKMIFEFQQQKRRENWLREDNFNLERLNFPNITSSDRKVNSASMHQIYHKARHSEDKISVPLHPVMKREAEHRILRYRDEMYISRDPVYMEVPKQQFNMYEKYRGAHHLNNRSVMDKRFTDLAKTLSESAIEERTVKTDNLKPMPVKELKGAGVLDEKLQRRFAMKRSVTVN